MHPEFMSISLKVKEIVASTIDDITSVVTEAMTEPESDKGSDAEPDSESDDESDVDTETKPICGRVIALNILQNIVFQDRYQLF